MLHIKSRLLIVSLTGIIGCSASNIDPSDPPSGLASDGAAGETSEGSASGPGDSAAPDTKGADASGDSNAALEASDPLETGSPDGSATDAGPEDSEAPHAWSEHPYVDRYAGLESLTGQALVDELCKLVTENYVSISYTAARGVVLQHVDNHEGQVRTVYEGLLHQAATAHTELNIEHTWPQSLGAEGIAKSDMHHLFPERNTFNSARSNYPFGEVVKRTWPATLAGDASCTEHWADHAEGCYSKKGTDSAGVMVFEPRDAHKGDAARAVFYFSLRYGTACKVKPLAQFDADHPLVTESILKHWNYVDQPDDHERRRNDLVEHTQRVRNPFIDHPELIDLISFQ